MRINGIVWLKSVIKGIIVKLAEIEYGMLRIERRAAKSGAISVFAAGRIVAIRFESADRIVSHSRNRYQ